METDCLFCTFRVGGHLFGVDILDVKEVTTETMCTRIAHAPDEVLGLVNIRGHIYLALDLRRLLGIPAADLTIDSRLVLFKPSVGSAFGIIVDQISRIISTKPECIEPYSSTNREMIPSNLTQVDLITSLCKLPDELLVVLNPRRFLPIVEQNLMTKA